MKITEKEKQRLFKMHAKRQSKRLHDTEIVECSCRVFDSIDSSLGQVSHLHGQAFSSESSSWQFCLVEDEEVSNRLSKKVHRMGRLSTR